MVGLAQTLVTPPLPPPPATTRGRRPTPWEVVLRSLSLRGDLLRLVPRQWDRVGDVVVLRLPPALQPHSAEVASAFAKGLGATAVLQDMGPIVGDFREPRRRLLWGATAETILRENGLEYGLDASRIMFSPGNLRERIRMGITAKPGEVIVDLFAGIGYFTLPMAFHGRASRVYACEVSPLAHGYLVRNLALNGLTNVVPLLGDCRDVAPEGLAHRAVLGWLWQAPLFLPKALRTLLPGGILHYHSLERKRSRAEADLKGAAYQEGRRVEILGSTMVKRYAPGVKHVVVDCRVD